MSTERTAGGRVRLVLAHVSIYLAALVFASPLIYAVFSAMKPNNEMFSSPPRLVGSQLKWTNFIEVFTYGPFITYLLNSLFVAVTGTLLVLAISSTAAFAFARLRWKGREAVFLLFLATLMVPAEVVMIPMYTLMDWFGWINSYQALIIPFAFSAFGTFLLRQFYRGIPYELDEAARVDGAGSVRIYWSVILPLSRSALAVLAGVLVLMQVPTITHDLNRQLAPHLGGGWLAGVLDMLGDLWDSLSPMEQGLLMLAAGALVVFSGGGLGLAFDVGLGLAMLGSAQMRAKASVSSPVGADSTSPPAVMRKGSMSGEPTAAAVPGRPRADEGPRRSAGPLVSTLGVSGAPW